MKKVLFISYYFPPMGLSGVQRSAKFVKYLPEFGWEPIVLTVKDVLYHAYDPNLLKELVKTKIIRTESFDPLRIGLKLSFKPKKNLKNNTDVNHPFLFHVINRHLFSWIFIPDVKIFWIPHALKEADRILYKHHIDLIFTTSPPHSVQFIGWLLKTKQHIPWIADFRDNWRTELFERGPTALHRKLDRWMATCVVSKADKVITTTEPIAIDFAQLTRRHQRDFFTIPNGFDQAEFSITPKSLSDSEKWTITYCGTLYPERNPYQFLQAVGKAIHDQPDLKKKLRIQFVGSVFEIDLMRMINRCGLNKMVEVKGYVPHQESIGYLMASDCLLLLIAKNESKGVATGKIYEYIASGKPILALVPEGEAKKLVIKHARGIVVPPDDVDGIKAQLIRAFDLWKRKDLKITVPRWKGIEQYSRWHQTKALADIFDRCVESK
ncbi:glycosyltransferase family 4 protein [bacterium]|nr:glycosyltransferase family 4 protein [bacterium]